MVRLACSARSPTPCKGLHAKTRNHSASRRSVRTFTLYN